MKSVAEAVARLREIEASAPSSDGVVCFARLYREVTEGVGAQLEADTFQNRPFVEALDLGFADLFFAALTTFERRPKQTPRAWLPLFQQRSRRDIAPLQFAVAGMNAHINRDLPVALVGASRTLGLSLRDDSPEHADYLRVNALLAKVEARVRRSYLTGWARSPTVFSTTPATLRTSSRCGTWRARGTPPGRTGSRSGTCATTRICPRSSSSRSTGWSGSRARGY